MSLHKLGCCCCVSYFPPLSDGNHTSNRLHMHTPTGTCMDLPFLELFPSFFRDTVQDRPVLFHHVDKAKRPCYSNRFSAIDTISRTEIAHFLSVHPWAFNGDTLWWCSPAPSVHNSRTSGQYRQLHWCFVFVIAGCLINKCIDTPQEALPLLCLNHPDPSVPQINPEVLYHPHCRVAYYI